MPGIIYAGIGKTINGDHRWPLKTMISGWSLEPGLPSHLAGKSCDDWSGVEQTMAAR
jgi:hypothetical protein